MAILGRTGFYNAKLITGVPVTATEIGLTRENAVLFDDTAKFEPGNSALVATSDRKIIAYAHDMLIPDRALFQVLHGVSMIEGMGANPVTKARGTIRSAATISDIYAYMQRSDVLNEAIRNGTLQDRRVVFNFNAEGTHVDGSEILADGQHGKLTWAGLYHRAQAADDGQDYHFDNLFRTALFFADPRDTHLVTPQMIARMPELQKAIDDMFCADSLTSSRKFIYPLQSGRVIELYESAAQIFKKYGFLILSADCYGRQSVKYSSLDYPIQAIESAKKALALFTAAGDKRGIMAINQVLGIEDTVKSQAAELPTEVIQYITTKWGHLPECRTTIEDLFRTTFANPEFQKDPAAFTAAWRARRGYLENLIIPDDPVLAYLEEKYPKAAPSQEVNIPEDVEIYDIPQDVTMPHLGYYQELLKKALGAIYVEAYQNKASLDANKIPEKKLDLLAKLIASIAAIQVVQSGSFQGFMKSGEREKLYGEFGFDPQSPLLSNTTGMFIAGFSGLE